MEHWAADHWGETYMNERQLLQDQGMEFIKFSAADGERFVDLAYDATWESLEETIDPAHYAKLKELSSKDAL